MPPILYPRSSILAFRQRRRRRAAPGWCAGRAVGAELGEVGAELGEAADVAGGEDLRAGGQDGPGFLLAQRRRRLRAGRGCRSRRCRSRCAGPAVPVTGRPGWRAAGRAARGGRSGPGRGGRHRDRRCAAGDRCRRAARAGRAGRGRRRHPRRACGRLRRGPRRVCRAGSRWYSRMVEPQPAALVTMASTSAGKAARLRRAKACAAAQSPECQARPPQQPWPDGMTTSTPLRASTSMVAVLMSGSSTCWAQPVSSATRARRSPRAGVMARPGLRGGHAGGREVEHGLQAPAARAGAWPGRAPRRARPTGNVKGRGWSALPASGGACRRPSAGTWPAARARNGLMRSRYGTPLGQAGSHARQPRQRSMCGCAASQARLPSSASFISTMRPRGLSISCPKLCVGRADGEAEAAVDAGLHGVGHRARPAGRAARDGWSGASYA